MLTPLHLDFEYSVRDGVPIPICMSARTSEWERCYPLLNPPKAWPEEIRIDESIVTGWHAWAEAQCIEVLGWERPPYWIDPAAEFAVLTNHPHRPSRQLYAALRHIGVEPPHSDEYKKGMQLLAQNHETLNGADLQRLMDYCSTDTWCSLKLWEWIEQTTVERQDINAARLLHALIRGAYSATMGRAMVHGMPLNGELATFIRDNKAELHSHVTRQAARAFPMLFNGESFNHAGFAAYLEELGLLDRWPRTQTGNPRSDKDTLRDHAHRHPELAKLAGLQEVRGVLDRFDLEFYGDRGRTLPNLFWTVTSRGNPKNTRFLWSLPKVFRGLAQAEPGMKLVVADYKSAEIMVAACLMQDERMIAAYSEEDFYVAFGELSGMAHAEAVENRHLLKQAVLGNSFGQSAWGLAQVLGTDLGKAQWLLHKLKHTFRQWNIRTQALLSRVKGGEKIYTPLGWRMDLGRVGRRRGGRYDNGESNGINFRIQASAQDLLRWAVVKLDQAGFRVVATNHDSIVCYMPEDQSHAEVAEIMAAAGHELFGHPFRVDVEVYRHGDSTVPKGHEDLFRLLTEDDPFEGTHPPSYPYPLSSPLTPTPPLLS